MTLVVSYAAGLIFGLGLIVSGMGNPAKVQGFLDLAETWDPSLALVMSGAIAVGLVAFRIGGRKTASLLGEPMRLPTQTRIDTRLVAGSALFGVGWGLAGICPGPGLLLVGFGEVKGIAFVAAMLVGMALFELFSRVTSKRPEDQAALIGTDRQRNFARRIPVWIPYRDWHPQGLSCIDEAWKTNDISEKAANPED